MERGSALYIAFRTLFHMIKAPIQKLHILDVILQKITVQCTYCKRAEDELYSSSHMKLLNINSKLLCITFVPKLLNYSVFECSVQPWHG